ncbi:MAG: RadC family protein [Oscillospiraceae bacterium]|nr:RadC family protein [Oscillospiraceae bacterium]
MKKQEENIHAGHRERMRERFEQNGLDGFHDHEVLEMLLFYAIPRGDTNALAHELLREFGSLQDVLRADPEQLCRVRGIGANTAVLLRFAGEFHTYVEQNRMRSMSLQSTENRFAYFRSLLSGCSDENMLAACLDDEMKVLRLETLAKGAPGHVQVGMQVLIRTILQSHCRSVILAHNHPNGKAVPSEEDICHTQTAAKLLHPLQIELIDHIIVAPDDVCSMRSMGILEPHTLG